MTLKIAAMDPLLPSPCLLCGERLEAEGYSERFRPELLGMPMDGFAPAILVEGRPSVSRAFAGFVCPECFGDGAEDLAQGMKRGASRLRALAESLERGGPS